MSRSSTVKTLDLRTSWTPQRNSTKTFATFSKESPLLSTSSFWVWAAPSTTLTIWSLSRNWVSILKELKSLPPSSMCTPMNFAAKLVNTRRALSSTVINSHQEPVSGQACNPPDPHWFFLSFSWWRSFTVLGTCNVIGGLSPRSTTEWAATQIIPNCNPNVAVPKWLLFLN